MESVILLVLAAGVPYYIVLEAFESISNRAIFLISATLLLGAIIASLYLPNEHVTSYVMVAFVSALYSLYKATKTTNFYRLGYYLIFVNAPFFLLFEEKGALYSTSFLVSLLGIYLVARFYERHYASANYHYIRGITLSTPYIGTYLSIYLISLALYPPFPNSLFFLSYILHAKADLLWYVVVITLFFGNFYLAMQVMKASLFGKPNHNIHYVELNSIEKVVHFIVVVGMMVLSVYGFKELLL